MNPIEAAVSPLKSDAIAAAEKFARVVISRVTGDLAQVDNDLQKLAPYPSSTWPRSRYMATRARRDLVLRLALRDEYRTATVRRPCDPFYVQVSPILAEDFVRDAARNAQEQYDAFVAKLCKKIGPVVEASLTGNHVWSHSTLRVIKADGSCEWWVTHGIVNVSKLGKIFNQWPTRKVKDPVVKDSAPLH